MSASATCSTPEFLPQKVKRFDSVSFAAFRLRCPGSQNSVAFEFRVVPLELNFYRKRRNALTRIYASATCSTSDFLPQTAKRFDLVSVAAFRLPYPGCQNIVAFEFRVIPFEDLPLNFVRSLLSMYASATCSTSDFLPQTAKPFDSVSVAAFRLPWPGCRNSVAFEFRVIPLENVCFCYLFYIRLSSANGETL
ncbi:hypothetical protein D5086_021117 [Populus alba]|uniref:Uncharacterized protein n=1 Tax=Populus alba TaxID=43335 RepID=A0ACC4BB76_POPAL